MASLHGAWIELMRIRSATVEDFKHAYTQNLYKISAFNFPLSGVQNTMLWNYSNLELDGSTLAKRRLKCPKHTRLYRLWRGGYGVRQRLVSQRF